MSKYAPVICDQCGDSGWRELPCDGATVVLRGRTICHRFPGHCAHTYVVPCGCRDLNANYNEAQYGAGYGHGV